MRWFVLILVVGILLVGGSLLVAQWDSTEYGYTGKEVFQTTQEYQVFKEAMGRPGIDLRSVSILSSEPPIVVQFKVFASRGLDFPYGDRSSLPVSLFFGLLFGAGGGLTAAALFLGFLYWRDAIQ